MPKRGNPPLGKWYEHDCTKDNTGKFRCALCGFGFASRPDSPCPGIRRVVEFPLPPEFATRNMLSERGLKPGGEVVAVFYTRGSQRYWKLYNVADAIPMRPGTMERRALKALASDGDKEQESETN